MDDGNCLYVLDTGSPCLGMFWIKNHLLCSFSSSNINYWATSQFYSTFDYTKSAVVSIERYERPDGKEARILSILSDGSLRLLSPVTGSIQSLGFPSISNSNIAKVTYDVYHGIYY